MFSGEIAFTTKSKGGVKMIQEFLQPIRNRRSVYTISDKTSVPNERIVELVKEAVLHTPSSFHMQSGRAAALFGGHHRALWEIVLEVLKERVALKQFPATRKSSNPSPLGTGRSLFQRRRGGKRICANVSRVLGELRELPGLVPAVGRNVSGFRLDHSGGGRVWRVAAA